jgi:hypothetical protein
MRRLGLAVCALLLAVGCDAPPPQVTQAEVPAQFLGAWDENVGACGQGGPNAVTVTPTEVVMEHTKVAVTGVARDGDKAVRVVGRLTGPGQEWEGSVRLELGESGRELIIVNGATIVPRVKCP